MDENTNTTLESLLQRQNEILQKLEESSDRKKDFWDKFSTLSVFLSGLLVAGAGLVFTHFYNERSLDQTALLKENEQKIMQMQTLETFIPHLIGKEEEKEVALIAITTLGSEDIANQLSELLKKSKGARRAGDTIMATATSVEQVALPQAVTASAVKSQETRTGWVYMGDFGTNDMRWETKYFDELSSPPQSYRDSTLTVRKQSGALNVREGPPTTFGRLRKVVAVLRPGSKVIVDEIQEWRSSGYMWAKVRYTPQ